ncbi:MAG: hypothetical protein LC798_11185 [Chloroflexi bacterium]|nr:hypothetical protein [Chloroflexota bacterium]
MAIATLRRADARDETHHGLPVLEIHAGEPVPTPAAPQRYAVRITPDLARFWLTLNHPLNRRRRERQIQKYASDMRRDLWVLTPQSIIFSTSGTLEDGQNRLMAVTVYGRPVWMMVDFGWPEGIINQIDRGAARIVSDAFKIEGVPNSNIAAAAVVLADLYEQTVGTALSWTARPTLSAIQALQVYRSDEAVWHEAVKMGSRVNEAHKALSKTMWAGSYYIIAVARGERDTVDRFYLELIEGTGEPGSVTRKLEKEYTRRKISDTVTGDRREPVENIIRAFNAWDGGKTYAHVTRPSFTLTRPRMS